MKILAFDPGGITGLCGFHSQVGVTMQDQICTEERHNVQLYALLELIKPELVVCERFDYHGGRMAVDLTARNYIGVIELWCDQFDVHLEMQKPSTGKDFWDDKKMKKAKLYKPGLPHANDATRHLLYYLTFVANDHRYLQMLSNQGE